jgi:Leucine-rich repeat (LRR) protein
MTQAELLHLIAQAVAEGWTELNLASHDLTELPPELANLTQLKRLNLSGNPLGEIPQWIRADL